MNAGEISAYVSADRLPRWSGRTCADCGRVQQFLVPVGQLQARQLRAGLILSSPFNPSARVKTGGSITVLESSGYSGSWTTLDPAQNKEGAATQDFMTAIYGQLFELGTGGKIVPDLATGYTFSPDAKTVTITLRQGVKFTDGTPFNAQAVANNWKRDLGHRRHQRTASTRRGSSPSSRRRRAARPGRPSRPPRVPSSGHRSVHDRRAPDRAERRVHRPALRLDPQLDRVADRAAERGHDVRPEAGRRRAVHGREQRPEQRARGQEEPELLGDRASPYLDEITFKTVGSDEAAYEALLANQGQVYENMSTSALITESEQHFRSRTTSARPRTTCS